MKKVLLATTMLVAGASIAAAEVTLSGDARMGILSSGEDNLLTLNTDEGDTVFTSRARVTFTLSGESGRFGQAGPKIGSAPLWWGCQMMPAVVGEKKAREILFLVRQYDAYEAMDMGLVNKVVPDDQLDDLVDEWCDEILRKSPQGLRLAKIAMNTATDALYSSVQHGLELVALNHVYGPEPKEGIASFQEKRPADWRKFREGQGPDPATPPLSKKGDAKKPAAKKPAAKKAAATKPAATAKKATAAKKPAAPKMSSASKGSTGGRKATTRRTSR